MSQSLTPNEDAFRASSIPESIKALMARPGREGTIARIVFAMAQAQGLAQAQAYDACADVGDILDGFVQALGNIVAGLAKGSSDTPELLAQQMLIRITLHTRKLFDLPDERAESVNLPVVEVARA